MKFEPLEIKNVIDVDYQNQLYQALTDVNFNWHFLEDATHEFANDSLTSTPSFVNLIFHPSNTDNPYLPLFQPLLEAILEKSQLTLDTLLRIRVGFLLNTKYVLPSMPYKYNTPHRDYDQEHYTAVYYVNDSDGDTVVFHEIEKSEKYRVMLKSQPDKGKALVFNGWHYHASSCPKICTKRIAITLNFTAHGN
jgi:hypothetical protein